MIHFGLLGCKTGTTEGQTQENLRGWVGLRCEGRGLLAEDGMFPRERGEEERDRNQRGQGVTTEVWRLPVSLAFQVVLFPRMP